MKPSQTVCAALESMMRSATAICRIAGEASPECEDACGKVRSRAPALQSTCGLASPQIDFVEQRTAGKACGTGAGLGVGSPFPLTNGEEMIYHVPPYARFFLDGFEVKRTVEDRTYEQVGGSWSQIAATPAGTDDSPAPRADHPECLRPPDLHSFDSPGWVFGTRELSVGGGKKTSPTATGVEQRLNFVEWIGASGPMTRINSDRKEWSTVVKLRWSASGWRMEPGSSIGLGHVKL